MAIHVDYDYKKTFGTDEFLSVGTTTEMYKRGALPQPNPTDANAIWLAPNGSDSNAGTEAAPVLTLNNAAGKLTVTKTTVHIFRNGYVGELYFLETVNTSFPDSRNIQVEEGETATIEITTSLLAPQGDLVVNGVKFYSEAQGFITPFIIRLQGIGKNFTFENCEFNYKPDTLLGTQFSSNTFLESSDLSGQINIRNCTIRANNFLSLVTSCGLDIINTLFFYNGLGSTGSASATAGINFLSTSSTQKPTNIQKTYFINYTTGNGTGTQRSHLSSVPILYTYGANPPTSHQLSLEACSFYATDTVAVVDTLSGDSEADITMDSCYTGGTQPLFVAGDEALPSSMTVAVTNEINDDVPFKFVDETGAFTGDMQLFRLQFDGKGTPDNSGRYFLDSPLVGLGRVTEGTLDHDIEGKPWDASATILSGVDWLPDGSLVVIDNTTDKVYNITRSGVKISEFNVTTLLGAASSPRCVCYDKILGTLWISDQTSNTIFQTQIAGSTVISSFDYSDFGTELDIQGISHEESTDSLWMMGDFNDTVYNTTKSGALLSSFLVSLFDPGETTPRGIAVAPDGTLWADGFNNDTISHITRAGTLISSFPSSTYDIAANQPNDLTVDKNGYLIITNQSADTLSWVVGDGIVDLSPFTEMTSSLTAGFNKSLDFDYPAASINVPHNYINPVNIQDIIGDPHGGYDAERREFILTFGGGIQVSNIQWKKLRDMLADKGTKRMYPLGSSTDLFTPSAGSSAGTFSDTDNSVSPSSAVSVNMVPGHWRGFWVVISGSDYYVSSNDSLKMYLIDPLGNGFPSNGAVTFQAQYILVNTEVKPFEVNQDNYRGFKDGQGWRESTDDNQPYDFQIDNLALKETSTLEENI